MRIPKPSLKVGAVVAAPFVLALAVALASAAVTFREYPAGEPVIQNDYDGDLLARVVSADWQVLLDGWAVMVSNVTAQPIADLRVSLLVYVDGRRRRVTTRQRTCVAAQSTETFEFQVGTGTAPIGEHLLVLVQDSDDRIHNGELPYDADPGSGEYVTGRATFFPRTTRPPAELSIAE